MDERCPVMQSFLVLFTLCANHLTQVQSSPENLLFIFSIVFLMRANLKSSLSARICSGTKTLNSISMTTNVKRHNWKQRKCSCEIQCVNIRWGNKLLRCYIWQYEVPSNCSVCLERWVFRFQCFPFRHQCDFVDCTVFCFENRISFGASICVSLIGIPFWMCQFLYFLFITMHLSSEENPVIFW